VGSGKSDQHRKLMPNIVFWQDILSPHMSAWIRALASVTGVRVTLVAESKISARRESMGWSVPDYGRSAVIVCRDLKAVADLIRDASDDDVHVVSGMRGCPLAMRALSELDRRHTRVGIISEAPDGAGWRGLVRRCIYQRDRARFATSIDFLLAMGNKGVDWFAACGYPTQKLFPFAYVTERQSQLAAVPDGSGPTVLVYVGEFAVWKGLDTLLEALAGLRQLNWVITMIGAGPLQENCRRMVYEKGLSERVRFLGVLKNQTARLEIGGSDLLLLPSRHDGWGAVVNEAIMEGVPVICSDHCGARDLLQERWRGEVFTAGSVASLREVLSRWIPARRTSVATNRIRHWSRLIEGESLASYFMSILECVYANGVRPTPPWLHATQEFPLGEPVRQQRLEDSLSGPRVLTRS
jgi:glycosyltransferase involved in cell wall biosynthesis